MCNVGPIYYGPQHTQTVPVVDDAKSVTTIALAAISGITPNGSLLATCLELQPRFGGNALKFY